MKYHIWIYLVDFGGIVGSIFTSYLLKGCQKTQVSVGLQLGKQMVYGGMCIYIYMYINIYYVYIMYVIIYIIYIYVTHAQLDWFINPTGPSFGKWCKWLRHVTTLLFAFCCIIFSFDVICILQLCSCHYSHMSQTCFRDGPCTFQKCWPHV